ncbi:MAG: hypothetical protein V4819_16325 [Verrucomicrobiota bacterium]
MDTVSPEWFDLPCPQNRRFALFLPSRSKEGVTIRSFDRVSEATARALCALFGGVTSYPANGMFRRETGIIQNEALVVLECFCQVETWNQHASSVRRLVTILGGLLDQESVACSLDGNMIFVSPSATDLRINGEIEEAALAKLLSRDAMEAPR